MPALHVKSWRMVFVEISASLEELHGARLPEVSGVLATSVRFPSDSRERIVNGGLELLASCHHSAKADEQKWSNALDACHVRIKFRVPRAVVVNGTQKVTVSEMIITFPLCSTGYIVVRSEEPNSPDQAKSSRNRSKEPRL